MWVIEGVECDLVEIILIDFGVDKLEKLIMELLMLYKDYDLFGWFKVESKKDLVKCDVVLLNIVDVFIMVYCLVKVSVNWVGVI